MSIPKEPRQLMINLMYLVLTAMLALNVSAEIINAFFVVDKGIKKSNEIVGTANDAIIRSIDKQVEAYPQYKQFKTKAAEAHEISKEFYAYVKGIRDEIIEAAGGIDPETDKPKDKKNKDVTTRLLVGTSESEGQGEALKELISQRDNSKLATAFALKDNPLPEPLCAIWEQRALKDSIAYLQAGNGTCPRKFLINSDVQLVFPEQDEVLWNANSKEEYKIALERIR